MSAFAVKFDDMVRHAASNVSYKKLETCQRGTDLYYAWMGAYTLSENVTVNFLMEDDGITYTFYTRNPPYDDPIGR